MLLEAGWNYGWLELDFLLWLVSSSLLPWIHLSLRVPLCWECKLLLPLAHFPHIVGGNSLLSVCDAGWCVVPGPLVGSLVWWLFPRNRMGSVWACLLVCWTGVFWHPCAGFVLLSDLCLLGLQKLLHAALLGRCLFGWGSLPNVQTV